MSQYRDDGQDATQDPFHGEDETHHEMHAVGKVSVGGGPSQYTNIAVLAGCLFGIIYALVVVFSGK